MHMLKKIARGFSSQLLKFALFFAAMSAATVAILGTPEPIKQAVRDSGLYTKIVGNVIESAKREQAKKPAEPGGTIDLNDPAIQKAVQDALPPEYIERTANGVLDGVFNWLEGETPTPQITIDLTEPKQKLAAGIGEAAYAKAASKPACTAAQLRTLDRNNLDIINIPCIPPGIDLRAEQAKLVNQISGDNQVLPDTTITFDDLNKGKDGQPTVDFAQLDKVPTLFKVFTMGALIWGAVALVAAAGVLALHDERRRGLWVISRALLMTGIVILIGVAVTTLLANQVRPAPENQNDLVLMVPDIVKALTKQFNRILINFGAVYVIVGAAGMVALRLTRPKVVPTTEAPAVNEPPAPDGTPPTEPPTSSDSTPPASKA